jgi:hypothetical protein
MGEAATHKDKTFFRAENKFTLLSPLPGIVIRRNNDCALRGLNLP